MSKYIDADLYVEMQIYDDEHEEWSIWNGTIEELLDQYTEQGCPPSADVVERKRGCWRTVKHHDETFWKCSQCEMLHKYASNYCSSCGSDMRGISDED